jgi:hypothetical protein
MVWCLTTAAIAAVVVAAVVRSASVSARRSCPIRISVTQVVDTNPDPNIVARRSPRGLPRGSAAALASVLTFNGTIPGPEFR